VDVEIQAMKIMLDCSPAKIAEYSARYGYEFWQLRTPLTAYKLAGVPYALDNGCFSRFERRTWERMVDEARESPPVFVTLPDIVGSAARTLDLFECFKATASGLPMALVLQDGIGNHRIDWRDLAAVFVGGSDAFKISSEARDACRAAKMLGKWVHVGRVNTAARVRDWIGLADSIDGSGISRYDHMLEDVLAMIRGEHPQAQLEMAS
jgi:hypothetical protein